MATTDVEVDNWSAWNHIRPREASFMVAIHILSLYGIYLSLLKPWFFIQTVVILYVLFLFGINLGAHRFYAHRAFKANLPLRILFVAAQTYNGQIGWIMSYRHPKTEAVLSSIPISDLQKDPLVFNQNRYYVVWYAVVTLMTSYAVPSWQGMSLEESFFITYILRYVLSLHMLGLVNSYSHRVGTKDYNKDIFSTNNRLIGLAVNCDGWHNFHHQFPWDYRSSELGIFNPSAYVVDALAAVGWVTHRRAASARHIAHTAAAKGDGSWQSGHPHSHSGGSSSR